MRLFELTENDPQLVRLAAATNQLKSDIDAGVSEKTEWTPEELILYYRKNGIDDINKDILFDIFKKPPLNKAIDNIQPDKVVFKGQKPNEQEVPEPESAEDQKVVAQMAQNAMK